jgi:serine/threonine protein kinase
MTPLSSMEPEPSDEDAIYDCARKLTDPAERAAYLNLACGEDAALRARLDALLKAAPEADDFFNRNEVEMDCLPQFNPGGFTVPAAPSEQCGDRIGHYLLLHKIGEGGFGTVWEAEQEQPLKRRVALKILKLGMDTREVMARFEQERQTLAIMDHPNIAKIFDAGATDRGRPYFVMELVRGVNITAHCDEKNLPTEERLKLFLTVCQAVHYAHQKGIIHRDLKPSNILVTLYDGAPVPMIIDFGVAKAAQGQLAGLTILHQIIGTPPYMSPEQASLSGMDIDIRSDIYALGVLLYELLTGRTPITSDTLHRLGLDEIRRIIREQDSPLPSTALNSMTLSDRSVVAHHRKSDPPKLIRQIRGDLDSIAMKALEKDRRRRYDSASVLAADVERYLASEPVLARPAGRLYRLMRMARRNKAACTAASVVFLAILIGGMAAAVQTVKLTRSLQRLKATAPAFSDLSRQLRDEEKLGEALEKVGFALELDPANPAHLIQRADLLQAMQHLDEAAQVYRRALALQENAYARANLNLCERLLAKNGTPAPLSPAVQIELADALIGQGRALDAAPLCKLIGAESKIALPRIRARLEQERIPTLANWDWNRLGERPNGTYSLHLGGYPLRKLPLLGDLPITDLKINDTEISDLSPLVGLHLSILNCSALKVSDLRPLSGMPLTELDIGQTPVTDLSPLKGAPLEWLRIYGTGITDLGPLRDMPLKHLQAGETPIVDLSPLSGLPLEWFHADLIPAWDFSPLANTRLNNLLLVSHYITDLSFVRNLPLTHLSLHTSGQLRDFKPLADCKLLEELVLSQTDEDISFLRALPNLKRIGMGGAAIPAEEFWRQQSKLTNDSSGEKNSE